MDQYHNPASDRVVDGTRALSKVYGKPLPDPLTEAALASDGWYIVQPDDPAPAVGPGQVAERSEAPVHADGVSKHRWTVRDLTLDELPWQDAIEARKAVVVWIDGLTSQIEALYPSAVQRRWEIEEAAARAVDAGNATDQQLELVTREGAAKGRTPQEHAAAIIENATRFRAIADQTNTLFLATDAQLQAASSPLEYPAIFAWAQQQAAPLAAAYELEV